MSAPNRRRVALRSTCFAVAAMLVASVLLAEAASGQRIAAIPRINNSDVEGSWDEPLDWGIKAAHMILLHTGKVLVIDQEDDDTQIVKYKIFDPTNDSITVDPFDGPTGHYLFCAGHSQLPDGRILLAGGRFSGIGGTSIYDPTVQPSSSSWIDAGLPPAERFYPTCTTLGSGEVLVTAGYLVEGFVESADCKANTPNLFDSSASPAPQWYEMTGATYSHFPDIGGPEQDCDPANYEFHLSPYPFMFLLSNGNVLYCGADEIGTNLSAMYSRVLNPTAETWNDVFDDVPDPIAGGSAVHFRPNVVMKAGGFDGFGNSNKVYSINMNAGTPKWTQLASMQFDRKDFYLIALPDGQILTIGGGADTTSVYNPEIFDPEHRQLGWQVLAPMTEMREYHSSAVLLPDARVVIAGGDESTTAQIFSPPYLFTANGTPATRPAISLVASQNIITYGNGFTVTTSDAADIERVSLIRLGAATHSFDHDQRFIPLEFTAASNSLSVEAPASGNHAPPGYYMLFIVNDDGVPSVAQIVKLQS